MRLLPDTHCWLWWGLEPARLGTKTRELLENPANDAYFSVVCAWEISVKSAFGKLELELTPADFVRAAITKATASILPIGLRHALTAGMLPAIHPDPFDRMLVAQAQCNDLTIITADHDVAKYSINVQDATA